MEQELIDVMNSVQHNKFFSIQDLCICAKPGGLRGRDPARFWGGRVVRSYNVKKYEMRTLCKVVTSL